MGVLQMARVVQNENLTAVTWPFYWENAGELLLVMPDVRVVATDGAVVYGQSSATGANIMVQGHLASGASTAIYLEGADAQVVIGSRATVTSSWIDSSSFPTVFVNGFSSSFSNMGSILSSSGGGVQLGSEASGFNSGHISGASSGVYIQSGVFVNEGTIVATGFGELTGAPSGFRAGFGGHLLNGKDGVITANGSTADAVRINLFALGPSSVENHGSILSEGGVGVSFEWTTGDPGAVVINTGLISGETIAIEMGDSDDKVVNSGQILGSVMLRGGNDLFDGIGGRVDDSNLAAGATVFGGVGQDVFRISDQRLAIDGEGGTDRIESTLSWDLSDSVGVENLTLLGLRDTHGTGNGFVNFINGNNADNVLAGLGDGDYLYGNAGADRLIGGRGNDSVDGGDGADVLFGGIGNDSMIGLDDDDQAFGGAGDDYLGDDDGDDLLVGGAGNDRLTAGAGDDTGRGGEGADSIEGGSGDDRLFGGSGNDTIRGGAGEDNLSGTSGRDTLAGDAGSDTLSGGAGADLFDFNLVTDSLRLDGDDILDFQLGLDDIDLSTVDSNMSAAGDLPFVFRGTAAFTALGQIRIVDQGNDIRVEMNTTGSLTADMEILVRNVATLSASDFIL
jgi:Ca2+-binding RTX toxin-like protein